MAGFDYITKGECRIIQIKMSFLILYRVSKKKGDLKKHGHNYSEIHQKEGKVGVFWKIQLKCCRIGPKHFKIGVKMA